MSNDERFAGEATAGEHAPVDSPGALRRDELLAELELLRERNRRLRESYVRAQRSQYRRTAVGLAGIGLVAVAGSAVLPGVREILLVLGAIGLFGGLLTFYLTPEQFVSATVGTAVYDAVADDRAATVAELGLSDERVYVPVGATGSRVRLYVPQFEDFEIPADDELERTFVAPAGENGRGLALRPVGEPLFDAFENALSGSLGETPETLATQLVDALTEQFDLAHDVTADLARDDGRLTVDVSESVYGPVDRIDHPVASLLAVGLARGLDEPVTVEAGAADGRAEYHVTCRWESNSAIEE